MGFGAFLVTFCAGKKSPGARGRAAPEEASHCVPARPLKGESALRGPGVEPLGAIDKNDISSPPPPRQGQKKKGDHHAL